MHRSLFVVGLGLALFAGGKEPARHQDRLAIQLVQADYGAPLRYYAATGGRWRAQAGDVSLTLPGQQVARWRISVPLGRPLTDTQLRELSGPAGVAPANAAARRLSRLPALAPPRPAESVALSARLLSITRERAHVSWVPVYAVDADLAWRGGRDAAFLRGLALERTAAPLARAWVRLAPGARVDVPSHTGTPVVLVRWRAAGPGGLRAVASRPADAIIQPPAA